MTTLLSSLSPEVQAYAVYADRPFVDVRCRSCGKLICKWRHAGVAELNVRCVRCGRNDSILLSTR